MSISPLQQEILDELSRLNPSDQIRVRDFVKALSGPLEPGEPGHQLLGIVGCIPPEDLDEISKAIEVGCERVDSDGWEISP